MNETKSEIEWIAFCKECGELYNAPNGVFVESYAKIHKENNRTHTVLIGTYI
jgi:hypothetical protein